MGSSSLSLTRGLQGIGVYPVEGQWLMHVSFVYCKAENLVRFHCSIKVGSQRTLSKIRVESARN